MPEHPPIHYPIEIFTSDETIGGLVIMVAIALIAFLVRHIVRTHNETTEKIQTPRMPDNQPPRKTAEQSKAIHTLPPIQKMRRNPTEQERREAFLNELREEVAPYIGLSKTDIASRCGMPEDTYLGEDGLPHTKNSDVDLWTVYISRTGNCFHSKKDCCGRRLYAVNFAQSLDYYQLPCFRCWNQFIPDTAWYRRYLDILRKLRTLNLSPTD